jgi:hypothetical protein
MPFGLDGLFMRAAPVLEKTSELSCIAPRNWKCLKGR